MSVNEKIIDMIQARLDKGQEEYKREVPIRRERGLTNLQEAIDEVLDTVVYLTAYLLEIEEDQKEKKPVTIGPNKMSLILRGLHEIHSEAYRENSMASANEIMELIDVLKKGSKWCHEDDKRIGQTDNPINKIHDVSPHDPGDENDNPLAAQSKCIPGSNCD
tara:strand:- start:4006 stop:4491 length:486 start_codon:yes stop_codon:yes gene_type:complete